MSRWHCAPEDRGRSGIDCVFLTCFPSAATFLAAMLRAYDIRLHQAESIEQADFLILATGSTVLLTDLVCIDGCWWDALEMLSRWHPNVVPLLVADPIDAAHLAGAPERGICSIIWQPIDTRQLARTIDAAGESSEVRRLRNSVRRRQTSSASAVPPPRR